ncbi:dermonecrotic toxin domain-containing protein [Pseudomonas syringae]|uniref:dermonecrotic toxin domain-containing protein n=1 Tax=Pseudomonas syringae TaxID=317 RepID=UPI003F82B5A1
MLNAAPMGKLARSTEQQSLGPDRFTPSSVAVREHRNRERADRIIDQFVERFTEKDFFPDDGDEALFALLVQLPEWPADLSIRIHNENDEVLAIFLKGDDESVVQNSVVLMQNADAYIVPDNIPVADDEPLLRWVFSQLPVGSRVGMGGNFPGSHSDSGRIVTLREQIAGLANDQRPLLFDALVAAGEGASKVQLDTRTRNPFLPLWIRQQTLLSAALSELCALYPQVPVGRLEELLEQLPLTVQDDADFLDNGGLPDSFDEAVNISVQEWSSSLAIDGLSRTRSFNACTDELAREITSELLAAESGRALLIFEPGDSESFPADPDDTRIVLRHDGYGNYSARDAENGEFVSFKPGTDSFYLAIGSQLKTEERSALGMQFEQDVKGIRDVLTRRAIEKNRGWFDPEQPTEIESDCLPDWFANATDVEKQRWKVAVQDYSQALLEAQAPDLLDPSIYGQPDRLRHYARARLQERILLDHGMTVDPDLITVHTISVEIDPGVGIDIDYEYVGPSELEPHYETQERSLTDLSLENIAFTNINFLLTSRAFDDQGQLVRFLNAGYLFSLIRDLNIGESYSRYLSTVLSTSAAGQWHCERYARVMRAQMRLDAIEAKMAGDFLGDGGLPPELANRGYKWVAAVLDHPTDSDDRAMVEGHRIQVSQLLINGVSLSGVLVIGTESRSSVATLMVFTPQAPDGICFREMSNSQEFRQRILLEPDFLDYLVGKAPLAAQADVRHVLTAGRDTLFMDLQPCTGNFLEAVYESEVARVISAVDEQTNTNWETYWESAWEITKVVGDIVLIFTPFKVQLPIAALRSFYAIWQGVGKKSSEQGIAPLYFVQAALLLADALTLSKGRRVRTSSAAKTGRSVLDPKTAVSKTPVGLKMRDDGIYRGIHEKAQEGVPSRFYAVQQEKAYAVTYDSDSAAWRVIDSRRPDAYYQLPIQLDDQGVWVHASTGLRGGGRHRITKLPMESAGGAGTPGKSAGKLRYKIHMNDFFDTAEFKAAYEHIQAKDLEASVKNAVEKYVLDGAAHLHKWKPTAKNKLDKNGKFYFLDLTSIGDSTGRGDWRLGLKRVEKGMLEPFDIVNHKNM